jgi:hypothetical protein
MGDFFMGSDEAYVNYLNNETKICALAFNHVDYTNNGEWRLCCKGDAIATKIFSQAFNKDPELKNINNLRVYYQKNLEVLNKDLIAVANTIEKLQSQKNITIEDIKLVQQYSKILEEKGFLVSQFVYGHYKQPHYKRELTRSKFMIWCGGTESQSIAQFQSWAMDVPTLVLKKEIFIENLSQFKASSSPYLTDSTGTFFDSNSQPERVINSWLAKIHTFSPRKWLQDNYTIELAFMNLTKIFFEIQTYKLKYLYNMIEEECKRN